MIGHLRGTVAMSGTDHLVIDVNGVGYVVHCAAPTLAALPPGAEAVLYTDMLVREDLMQLFGFRSPAEREWHRLLTRVQGVGAKVSLAILGAVGGDAVGRAIALGDATPLRAAPGVGPKLALRIVNELKDKAPAVLALGNVPASPGVKAQAPAAGAEIADAVSALVNLGYAAVEAQRAAMEAAQGGAEGVSEIIRRALRALAPKE